MLREDEEYEFSVCAEDAVSLHYPDAIKFGSKYWVQRQVGLQIELIKCHWRTMWPSDKRRAGKTLEYLQKCYKRGAYENSDR